MPKIEDYERKSNYNPNRGSYISMDGKYYVYEGLDGRRVSLEIEKDGVTLEWLEWLDESDDVMDIGDNREEEHRKHPSKDEDATGYIQSIPSQEPEVLDMVLGEAEEHHDPREETVRRVIDTKCNERQQNLFYKHFGMSVQMEQIRKEESEASGEEKTRQAILNVKNDVIKKVAKELGVEPIKRNKRSKK